MSLFNVGAGREPAEIGVAEYQKPDYQQYDKLAAANMRLKQHQLEKEQQKTKGWEDILTKDYTTKYGIEQVQFVQNGVNSIKDDLRKDAQKNPAILSDPIKMMQVKARLEQIGGFVKTLDRQDAEKTRLREDIQKDPYNTKYDKQYATDFINAVDDPINFTNTNPNSEISKFLAPILNSDQISKLPEGQKRIVVRDALLTRPLKPAQIAEDITPEKITGIDVSRPYANVNKTTGISTSGNEEMVSEPKLFLGIGNQLETKTTPKTERSFFDVARERFEKEYDTPEKKQALMDRYNNDVSKWAKEYRGDKEVIKSLNDIHTGENVTYNDLVKYDYYLKHAAASRTYNKERGASSFGSGEGDDYKKTYAGAAAQNKALISSAFGYLDVPIIQMNLKGGGAGGNIGMRMNGGIMQTGNPSSANTGGWQSVGNYGDAVAFNNSSVTAYPVFRNEQISFPDGTQTDKPLTQEQVDLLKSNPKMFEQKYGSIKNVSYAVAIIGVNDRAKKGIVVPAAKDKTALDAYRAIAKKAGDKRYYDLIPDSEYLTEKEYEEFNKKVKNYSTLKEPKKNF